MFRTVEVFLLTTIAVGLPVHDNDFDSCTSILVTQEASKDGASMVSHANDCTDCDFRVAYVPARKHLPGSMRPIYDGSNSRQGNAFPRFVDAAMSPQYAPEKEYPLGAVIKPVIGYIPQVESTYARWEGGYGFMNEKGLTMGESTCSGFFAALNPLDGGKALLCIRDLISLALERCDTASCGVRTMGELAEKYGFYGEDAGQGGAGESASLTDPTTGEAWVFHVMSDNATGAVWAAQRVPEGHVAVVANNFVIKGIDFTDVNGKSFMWSSNILDVARKAGVWDGHETFSFQKHLSPDIRKFTYFPGSPPIPHYTTLRLWVIFTKVAPSLLDREGFKDGSVTTNAWEIPFSVKAEKPVSLEDVMELHRSHYENTSYDMRKGILAAPFGNPNRYEGGDGVHSMNGEFARAISIQRTTYAMIGRARKSSNAMDTSAVWVAIDAPATSIFVPFYRAVLAAGQRGQYAVEEYGMGSRFDFDFRSPPKGAWWAFDFVNNWMDKNYQNMSERIVYPALYKLQSEVLVKAEVLEREAVEAAAAAPAESSAAEASRVLGSGQTELQRDVTSKWWQLAGDLIVSYNDGFLNFPASAPNTIVSLGYPLWFLQTIGYDHSYIFPKFPVFSLSSQQEAIVGIAGEQGTGFSTFAAISFTTLGALLGYVAGTRGKAAASVQRTELTSYCRL